MSPSTQIVRLTVIKFCRDKERLLVGFKRFLSHLGTGTGVFSVFCGASECVVFSVSCLLVGLSVSGITVASCEVDLYIPNRSAINSHVFHSF